MRTYTLLIWENVPEKTDTYLIPNEVADKYVAFFQQAHNKFINADDMNDGLRFLNSALEDEYAENGFEEYLGVLKSYKHYIQEAPIVLDADLQCCITNVYLSGFLL